MFLVYTITSQDGLGLFGITEFEIVLKIFKENANDYDVETVFVQYILYCNFYIIMQTKFVV